MIYVIAGLAPHVGKTTFVKNIADVPEFQKDTLYMDTDPKAETYKYITKRDLDGIIITRLSSIHRAFNAFQREYKNIIVDTPANDEEVLRTCIAYADIVYFIVTKEQITPSEIKKYSDFIEEANMAGNKVKGEIMFNKVTRKDGDKYTELHNIVRNIGNDKLTVIKGLSEDKNTPHLN